MGHFVGHRVDAIKLAEKYSDKRANLVAQGAAFDALNSNYFSEFSS